MPTRVILDVDTGTDDAVALMVAALSPDLELVGATAVNGNTGVDATTANTLRVLDLIGRPDIPVFRGMAAPMLRPQGATGGWPRSSAVLTTRHIRVDVETTSSLAAGRTICDVRPAPEGIPNVHLAFDADGSRFVEMLVEILGR